MKILVDGDIIAYRCGFAAQKTRYSIWLKDDCEPDGEKGEWCTKLNALQPLHIFDNAKDANAWLKTQQDYEDNMIVRIPKVEIDKLENCLHSVKLTMGNIQAKFPGGETIVYFSCPTADNWRTAFYPEYKANRPDRKPFWVGEIREYMEYKWNCVTPIDLEADDLIAMAAHDNVGSVVVTIDKDMDQIPGTHYNWVKDEVYEVSVQEAHNNLQVQVIMGDNTDNIKGIPGWGPAAAIEWLKGPDADAYGAYAETCPTEHEARYQFFLNRALVTLPISIKALNVLVEEVEIAKETYTKASEATCGEAVVANDGGTAG